MEQIIASKSFENFAERANKDLHDNFPNVLKGIDSISIGKSTDSASGITNAGFKMGEAVKSNGVYASCDSEVKSYVANDTKPLIRNEIAEDVKEYVTDSMEGLLKKGIKEDDAKRMVADSAKTIMQYDRATGQYVMQKVVKGVNDSLITSTQIPYWDIGYMNKIFKQPYTKSFAKNMVSVEGFGNAWADVVAVFKENFEGFGKISNTAMGTHEATSSAPVVNDTGIIMSDIINIAVDYETSMKEIQMNKMSGNWIGPKAMADRERYANMVLRRLQDSLIYFGNAEAGVTGLVNVNPTKDWSTAGYTPDGKSLTEILADRANTTQGATIVKAFVNMIADFQAGMKYMPTVVKVACSTSVYKALTSALYSDQFNPSSPIKILAENFMSKGVAEIDGVKKCNFEILADPMLDKDSVFNTLGQGDLMVLTAPSISSEWGEETGLVISPETLDKFIVPPMYQRGGYLYTMYKRMGGLIVPIKDTVKVYYGVGEKA